MFREGKEMPPVLDPERADFAEEREADAGSLQAGLMSPEDFVKSVLAREGGDPARAEMAADSIKKFWITQLDAGKITPEIFNKEVYESTKRMLKTKGGSQELREEHDERVKRAMGKRAA